MLFAAAACSAPRGPQVRVIDLLTKVSVAEKRPVRGEFLVEEHTFGGQRQASLVAPSDSRVTWQMALPRNATLHTSVAVAGADDAAAVTFMVAVSDGRVFEPLTERTVTPAESARGWVPLSADMSLYAGRKFSLFYQPDGRQWRVILRVNRAAGSADRAFWGLPGIDSDVGSARRFYARQPH